MMQPSHRNMYPSCRKGIQLAAIATNAYSFIWLLIHELYVNFVIDCTFVIINQYCDLFEKSSLLLKQLHCYRNIHMYDFHDDARDHHGSQCKH